MATLNKQSVRDEIDRVKTEFDQLCQAGKVSGEVKALMSTLLLVVELILSVFLEKTTKKNNKNASIPSSQTDKDETTASEKDSHGKGKQERHSPIQNTRTVETVSVLSVDHCSQCGEDLEATPAEEHERRTVIDIVFEKVVERHDAEIKQCPACQTTTKADFPINCSGPLQYGAGLKAYVINLVVCQMVALGRVQKLVNSMVGIVLAEATILRFILRLHQALESWEQTTIEKLLQAPAIHVDETSLRVDKKNHWIHVYASGEWTLKRLHRKRGLEAIEHINIIPRYGGVIIHDCWASYLSYDHCDHGLCGSHLLRDLTFIIESNGYAWARNMKRLLKDTCVAVAASPDKQLDDKAYANLQKRYRNIMTRGKKQLPPIPPKPKGKRGKIAKSDAHNLWERLEKHEKAVLLFAKKSEVAFTNNRAEQDLRMAKVKQKVSGCFRNSIYAEAYCRISSYLQTMANKGYNPLLAIQMALAGEIERGE
ncbi:MAG: Mobile element protein [uncultured Thiotrichaceae bacterium]|uniref:Mobile element protein n=1 Tax=uncultured Thiotrichaceae bacterium TaxID=298394 RepID=A0A6S6TI85_9GAMM|nr:MAG: Mobile element protein [uncultured Thiotrichaceae bacterium]